MHKFILFKGGIETLEYFSIELAKAFTKQGASVFFFDLLEEEESFPALLEFCKNSTPVMITFNFTGIRGDEIFYDETDELFWNTHNITCVNIVVDHPFYYDKLLEIIPKNYYQISIDRQHEAYMKRYYPHIKLLPFLPSGGTSIFPYPKPIAKRSMDIVFTGNYTPPATFNRHIERIDEEYTAFYHRIIDELIGTPSLSMEAVMEKHLIQELGELSNTELREAMANMIFIDLYVRFYFRGLVVKTLAESGLKVHLYGSGWDKLDCSKPENLILGGPLNSHECLQVIHESKISLNVMPWFKDGAHDRIFNSQLNGAVCLTDDSIYLMEQLTDYKDCVFYSLEDIEHLPDKVRYLLDHPELSEHIAKTGYETALASHTWEVRAKTILSYIEHLL